MKIANSIIAAFVAALISGCASSNPTPSKPAPPQPAPSIPAPPGPIKEPAVWYQVLPGMTMEQTHAILGQPQTKTDIQEIYRAAGHWELTVTYGNDGKVRSVVDLKKAK